MTFRTKLPSEVTENFREPQQSCAATTNHPHHQKNGTRAAFAARPRSAQSGETIRFLVAGVDEAGGVAEVRAEVVVGRLQHVGTTRIAANFRKRAGSAAKVAGAGNACA